MLTTNEWTVLLAALAVVVVAIAIALFSARAMRRRHMRLRDQFGPEYDRAVEEKGNIARAERELASRTKRIEKLHLRPLAEASRLEFSKRWTDIQARFVDDPSDAVRQADELIGTVMTARGYDSQAFEQRVADLSVEHPNVVQHYRAARVLADANREGRAQTEQLRQAFVHYRELFADLLERARATEPEARLQEVRA